MENKQFISFGQYLQNRLYLKEKNMDLDDIDIFIDGSENCIALCDAVEFTEKGYKHFEKALELPFDTDSHMIYSNNSNDYEDQSLYIDEDEGDGGVLLLAEDLLFSLAGYCNDKNYKKWFKDELGVI